MRPRGIEPLFEAPQASVLSIERRAQILKFAIKNLKTTSICEYRERSGQISINIPVFLPKYQSAILRAFFREDIL